MGRPSIPTFEPKDRPMKFKTLLLAALVSATAFAQTTVPITTTVNVPLQVTVTQTGTTITIAAQTTSIPIPPGCSTPQPPTTTTSVQCPAGSSGSYTQTTTYACVGSTWTPTTAPTSPPAGACTTTPPSSVNQVYSNGVAYWTFNMSYGATVNYTDTAGAALPAGTMDAAITVPMAGGWQPGVSVACQNGGTGCFDTTPYTYFVFSIKPTSSTLLTNNNLIMAWHHSPGDVTNGIQGVSIQSYCSAAANTWGSCKVPLSIFSLSSRVVSKFTLQSNVPATFYVNNVGFQ